eukprot:TRINITY_DN14052_c0_g1_i2.p1 TRINITY_DN14052_c0_g1~~TRINITY_DN14052_c0_g1_i2.p1  ORF type:complete len:198 (-),score=14.76 TRINITY_DN14052_c0_g1_i2:275-829(-)
MEKRETGFPRELGGSFDKRPVFQKMHRVLHLAVKDLSSSTRFIRFQRQRALPRESEFSFFPTNFRRSPHLDSLKSALQKYTKLVKQSPRVLSEGKIKLPNPVIRENVSQFYAKKSTNPAQHFRLNSQNQGPSRSKEKRSTKMPSFLSSNTQSVRILRQSPSILVHTTICSPKNSNFLKKIYFVP